VSNSGKIFASGGKVLLTANVAEGVVDHSINMSGFIEAKAATQQGGEIILSGGDKGLVEVSGKITAAGKKAGQTGGVIKILGDEIQVTGKAKINASGDAGGGQILIGGNAHGAGPEQNASYLLVGPDTKISANAITTGDGGKIVLWSNSGTGFYGNIYAHGGALSGNGGAVEVSGKYGLDFQGYVDAGTTNGIAGTLLLDPMFLIINNTGGSSFTAALASFANNASGTNIITATSIDALAANTNPVLQANSDIIFQSSIAFTNNNTLTATAGRSILIDANISTATGNKAITMTANSNTATSADRATTSASNPSGDTETTAGNITFASGASMTAGTGAISLTIGSTTTAPFTPGSITQLGTGNAITGGAITLSVPTASSGTIGTSSQSLLTTSTNNFTITSGSGGTYISNTGNLGFASLTLATNNPLTLISSGVLTLPNSAISTGTGNITLSSLGGLLTIPKNLTTTGNVNLTGTGVTFSNNTVVNAGAGTVTVNGGTGGLTMGTVSQILSTGTINISGDSIALNTSGTPSQIGGTGTGAGSASDVILQTSTAGTVINIGTGTTGFALSQLETNDVFSTNVRIGNASSGAMTITAWTPIATFAKSGVLTLDTNGGITQSGVINLATSGSNLLLRGAGAMTLTQANVFSTVAASLSSGALQITNASTKPLTVGSLTDDLGTVAGITVPAAVTLTTSGAGGSLTLNEGINTSGGANNISLSGVGITLASGKTVNAGSGTITANAGGGAIQLNSGSLTTTNATASAITLQNATTIGLGNITATSGTLVLGAGNVSGAVTQNSGTAIQANTLTANTSNSINLGNSGNDFGTISDITRGGAFTLNDADTASLTGLTIGGTIGITGGTITNAVNITTSGLLTINTPVSSSGANNISLTGVGITQAASTNVTTGSGTISMNAGSGTLTLNSASRLLSTGTINLTANGMLFTSSQIGGSAANTGNATNVILSEGTAGTTIGIGTGTGTLALTQTELNLIRTTNARIGGGNSGLITIGGLSSGVNFVPNAGSGVLTLDSGAGISVSTGSIILKNLITRAAGTVDLTTNATSNNIINLASTSTSGSLSVTNGSGSAMTVTSLADDIGTVNGITAPGGVTLNTNGALLTINQNINSTNNAISLTGTGITQAASTTVNSGSGTLSYNATAGSGGTLTTGASSLLLSTGTINLTSNAIAFDAASQIGGSALNTGNATNVIIAPSSGSSIGIGGATGTLSIPQSALNIIRTTNARIGNANTAGINIGTVSSGTNFIPSSGSGVLTLQSGSQGIFVTSGGGITMKNLILRSVADVKSPPINNSFIAALIYLDSITIWRSYCCTACRNRPPLRVWISSRCDKHQRCSGSYQELMQPNWPSLPLVIGNLHMAVGAFTIHSHLP